MDALWFLGFLLFGFFIAWINQYDWSPFRIPL